jgi:ABC-type cobalamin/Fe3+-siderophores transport system ATPase subunit
MGNPSNLLFVEENRQASRLLRSRWELRLEETQMQIAPYIRSLTVKNYRPLHNCSFNMGLINIIGGMNGVGKSSLLEAIFTLLDRMDPVVLLRPAIFRSFPFALQAESLGLFSNGNTADPIEIIATTLKGVEALKISYGTVAPSQSAQISVATDAQVPPTVQASAIGLNIEWFVDGTPDGLVGFINAPHGMMFVPHRPFSAVNVRGSLLTATNRYNPKDLADRYTEVVQSDNLQYLLDALRLVQPALKSLQLLQVGGQSIIHADIGLQIQIPINLLGDGAIAIAAIVLNAVYARGGVLLIDEFDTSIHYSVLSKVWSIMGRLAATFNTEIVVSTHSRECIQAATRGLKDVNLFENLNYIRLDRIGPEVTVTVYPPDELKAALDAEWEVR